MVGVLAELACGSRVGWQGRLQKQACGRAGGVWLFLLTELPCLTLTFQEICDLRPLDLLRFD